MESQKDLDANLIIDSKYWNDLGFTLVTTEDGSPSFRILQGESMHHTGGAFSETQLIYGTSINQAMQELAKHNLSELKICVVGLGMGYIEMCVAEKAIFYKVPASQIKITSWETSADLKNGFLNWLDNKYEPSQSLYNLIESFYIKSSDKIKKDDIRRWIKELHDCGQFAIEGGLDEQSLAKNSCRWHLICYDAFSAKTTQHLWQPTFLDKILTANTNKPCWFSTYACTGVLKRSLKAAGFLLEIKEGFKGKKNSTFAKKSDRVL